MFEHVALHWRWICLTEPYEEEAPPGRVAAVAAATNPVLALVVIVSAQNVGTRNRM
jgi:hypothetical protein